MKKFLYKIHSGYDGFFPKRIPERVVEANCLRLNWQLYIDAVDILDEVWVYFHGQHKFENGVYIKGIVQKIDTDKFEVYIRIRQFSTDKPLTDANTSLRVAEVVAPRYRQVFLYPQEWFVTPKCTVQSTADSCQHRLCEECPTWQGLSLINEADYVNPERLPANLSGFIPAFWVRPSRCYLYSRVAPAVRRTSEVFYRFKLGDEALAFPLALGIFESLRKRKLVDFDCVVPIPLSPDKAKAREINRTRLLANELSKLLGIRVIDALSLNRSISKRRMILWHNYTRREFEEAYYEALSASDEITQFKKILLLDDVCTEGTTLRCATRRIKEVNSLCEIFAVTAGQMIVKKVVKDETALVS